MNKNALELFIASIRDVWGELNTETVVKSRELLTALARAPSAESWLTELHQNQQDSVELYRDPDYGFILLAHFENQRMYRAPHNHGAGWVIYALQHGVTEMSTYGYFSDLSGKEHLVSRGSYQLNAGDCEVFLPGDIHDTRTVSDYSLMFRLTSCDFQIEKRTGRLKQFSI